MESTAALLAPSATQETVKMEQDFSQEVDVKIPEAQQLAKSGNLAGAIENLIALEKQTRIVRGFFDFITF